MKYKNISLLLADDDIDDCNFFKEALDEISLPTRLTVVNNGDQLMSLLTKPENLYHILFLDLNMPRKNGYECLSEIKLNKNLKQLHVIIFSTSIENDIVNLIYEKRAQYYIRKPSEFSQLKKVIQQALTLLTHENISQPSRENFVITT